MGETKTMFGVTINTERELRPEAYSDPEYIAQNYDPAVEAWENLSNEERLERIQKAFQYTRQFFDWMIKDL